MMLLLLKNGRRLYKYGVEMRSASALQTQQQTIVGIEVRTVDLSHNLANG